MQLLASLSPPSLHQSARLGGFSSSVSGNRGGNFADFVTRPCQQRENRLQLVPGPTERPAMGSSSENFCLRWNDFESNVSGAFRELRAESDFFDVTLACDDGNGRSLQAHKVILSACSSFFKQMLRNVVMAAPGHPCPLLYLRGVRFTDLESILDFMYMGEVNVAQEDLNSFLACAEDLQIKGLTQQSTKEGRKAVAGRRSGPSAKRMRRDDDDDKEVISVKNEPASSSSGFDASSGGGGASSSTTAAVTTESYGDDGGAVGSGAAGAAAGYGDEAFDDGYVYGEEDTTGGDESGMMEEGMGGAGQLEAQDGSKAVSDLNELVMGLLTYSDGIHTCNLCGKKSPWRTTMLRHVEANHVETAGHVCDICGQVSKTRHAFAMHKKRKHKVNMANEPLPDRPKQQQATL